MKKDYSITSLTGGRPKDREPKPTPKPDTTKGKKGK
jgi:hypothetical protein